MRDNALLEQAKDRLTIPAAWERLGLPGQPKLGVQKSPFRHDRNGMSFSIIPQLQGRAFKDHGNGSGGDVVNFIEQALGCTRREAILKTIELAGLGGGVAVEAKREVRAARAERTGWAPREMPVLPEPLEATGSRFERLALLRGLAEEGLVWLSDLGLLQFVRVDWRSGPATWQEPQPKARLAGCSAPDGWECWCIRDAAGCNAQVRRLDGQPLTKRGTKGLPFTGSWASWPVGCMAEAPVLLLVEGMPDMLAAGCLITEEGLQDRVAPVCLFGAGQPFHSGARAYFRGKTVIVCGQNDPPKQMPDGSVRYPGQEAAARWMQEARACGARAVRRITLPAEMPGKDLCDWMNWGGRKRGGLATVIGKEAL